MSDSLQPHGLYSPWNSPGQSTGVGSLPLLQGIFLTQESNPCLLHLLHWQADSLPFFTTSATWEHVKVKVAQVVSESSPWNSPGQNTGVDSHFLLQGIFPTQGSNPGLVHYRRILYQLSHKRSPRILEWIAYVFSRRSSLPRNQTGLSCIAGGFFTN